MKRKLLIIAALALTLPVMPVQAKMTKESHALYQKACTLEYQHKYADAIKLLDEATKVGGEDAMVYTKIAGLYSDLGDWQNSLAAYKKALILRPNDAFIYISIGNILQTLGNYKDAYASYMQAMEIFPDYKYNYLNIANTQYSM